MQTHKIEIKLRTTNGFLSVGDLTTCVNDNLEIALDTPLDFADFQLAIGTTLYSFTDAKTLTIPVVAFAVGENLISVQRGNRRWNCGKLFISQPEVEMLKMQDIESKYRADIEALTVRLSEFTQMRGQIALLQSQVVELTRLYNRLAYGVDFFDTIPKN